MTDQPASQTAAGLLPCPFCGDELRINAWTRSKSGAPVWRLFCMSDNDCFFMDFDAEADAHAMGNRRPDSYLAERERLLEALRALVMTSEVMARSTGGVKPVTRQPWLAAIQKSRALIGSNGPSESNEA